MNIIEKISSFISDNASEYRPFIFDLNNKEDAEKVSILFDTGKILEIVDTYASQLSELEEIRDPSIITRPPSDRIIGDQRLASMAGVWIYFPWKKSLVHTLSKDDFIELRTSRNAILVSNSEQKAFAEARIGIAGLNVGNPGALCITHEGGGRNMKFADFDLLSLSNLNRFNAGIAELGGNKAIITARQAYEIDPFITVELFEQGIKPENLENFLNEPKLDLLIEEMDNLKLKLVIREHAKKHRIPVLMVTADGIVDVERYDLEPDLEILAGNLDKSVIERINAVQPGKGTLTEKVMIARDFVGSMHHSDRLNLAFDQIGKTLPSIPQLSEWTFLRGALLGYFARKIVTGADVPSGRYIFSLETIQMKK